jgi:hypothetical protein
MKNEITEEAKAHLKVVPTYLNIKGVGKKSAELTKVAETLKLIDRSQGLCYGKEEFLREFGAFNYTRHCLRKIFEKVAPDLTLRIVEDRENIWVFANRKNGGAI